MSEKEAKKFESSNIFEGMTSISALLNSQCDNDRTILEVWVDSAKQKSKAAEIRYLRAMAAERGFSVSFVSVEEIDQHCVGSSHGGIIAFCTYRHWIPAYNQTEQPRKQQAQ